ncbi:MAG: 2-amino-4-hydroxy-6-hydroxymethyldihydropteridine diphosphokinase [Siculibacillus sp.]|nr:2-amino-4-hydroxy-6-hydroxymethyldihydropteridine diphosphokinase [Siculibacillus sp.]
MPEALIGLGGNLGDVPATLERALAGLEAGGVRVVKRSSNWRTPPWGPIDQPAFVNACVLVETELSPRALLDLCLAVEASLGRRRDVRWGPRSIDLDLLDHDGRRVDEPNLTLPHPRLTERAFVLVPLAEIVPDRVVAGATVAEHLAKVDATGVERV